MSTARLGLLSISPLPCLPSAAPRSPLLVGALQERQPTLRPLQAYKKAGASLMLPFFPSYLPFRSIHDHACGCWSVATAIAQRVVTPIALSLWGTARMNLCPALELLRELDLGPFLFFFALLAGAMWV